MITAENLKAIYLKPVRKKKAGVCVSQEWLKERMDYRDGELFWKHCPTNDDFWNQRYVGTAVGTHNRTGKRATTVDKKHYFIHRLIWVYHHGALTDAEHIKFKGSHFDNRIENLRLVKRGG